MNLPDGIYFALSFEDYLALERVSAGSLSDMMEGPAKWWSRSWLNPDKEDDDTAAKQLGRAYHCARLEPEEFHLRYCRELVQDDFDDGLLTSDAAIKAKLKELGEPQTAGGETILERAKRLVDAGFKGDIWHVELAWWETNARNGREPIKPKAWDEIIRDMGRIRANPEIDQLLSDGFSEVSILWTDERTGLQCKARPDWLTGGRQVHVKTWDARTIGKPGNRAVVDAFQYNGYFRTAWFYLMAMEAVRAGELTIQDEEVTPEQAHMIAEIHERPVPLNDWFLFLRRSGIPDIRARRIKWAALPAGVEDQKIGASTEAFRTSLTGLGRKAKDEVEACMTAIAEGFEIYGRNVWYPRDIIGTLEDDDFSAFWLDSRDAPR